MILSVELSEPRDFFYTLPLDELMEEFDLFNWYAEERRKALKRAEKTQKK